MSLAEPVTLATDWAFSPAIGYNDLYHLIQIVTLTCLCREARLSTASRIVSFAEIDARLRSLAAPVSG